MSRTSWAARSPPERVSPGQGQRFSPWTPPSDGCLRRYIHTGAVHLASRHDGLGRALGEALDRKIKTTTGQFARASDVAAPGVLLHHDGGREMSLNLLPGLIGRADRVVVAMDCVSHAAAGAARRLVRDSDKTLDAPPSLSLNSLLDAVAG